MDDDSAWNKNGKYIEQILLKRDNGLNYKENGRAHGNHRSNTKPLPGESVALTNS